MNPDIYELPNVMKFFGKLKEELITLNSQLKEELH